MAKLGKDKKGTKAKKVIKLDENTKNLNETDTYTAVTRKLAPLTVSLKPTEAKEQVANKILPAGNTIDAKAAFTAKADDRAQNYEPEKDNYLSDIMHNVRKIAAAIMLPVAVSLSAPDAKAVEPVSPVINLDTPALAMSIPAAPVVDVPAPAVNVPQPVSPDVQVASPAVNVPAFPVIPAPAASVVDVVAQSVDIPVPEMPDISSPDTLEAFAMPEKVTEKKQLCF